MSTGYTTHTMFHSKTKRKQNACREIVIHLSAADMETAAQFI